MACGVSGVVEQATLGGNQTRCQRIVAPFCWRVVVGDGRDRRDTRQPGRATVDTAACLTASSPGTAPCLLWAGPVIVADATTSGDELLLLSPVARKKEGC